MDFGCFVELEGVRSGKKEGKPWSFAASVCSPTDFSHCSHWQGLVHVSQIANKLVDVKKAVSQGQRVKVKVISMAGSKLSMSMKEVNQETGQDLLPQRSKEGMLRAAEEQRSNPSDPAESNPINPGVEHIPDDDEEKSFRAKKRLSSPELWEARQLISSGVLPVEDYPTFDAETGLLNTDETEEELQVEINECEPPFLSGQTAATRCALTRFKVCPISLVFSLSFWCDRELSPVRIVKNPDGSMQRAAMNQSSLAKERRELRQTQVRSNDP